ncbi:PelA/Pel-15E family pectate lyase [Haloferula luteola]|uniref:PelA/Pel-15E family pectate lyase n=1 Tax=Haloferula luteola TaxID=595692 RepID=A0A840V7F9_9BACT|nr:pectate lyase [Haloferula luteola]MBB5352976.1 PelA/Pel-15E family pectate lyase [Haloferula luteola]
MSHWLGMIAGATMAFSCVGSAAVTEEAVEQLAPSEQAAWEAYLQRSKVAAELNEQGLVEELSSEGLERARKAPDGADFKLPKQPGDGWYGSSEAQALAEVLLSYQTPAGGWSKHNGYSQGRRLHGMQWSSQYDPGHRPHYLGTIDNRATTAEIQFLVEVWRKTKRSDCREGVQRGLQYLLAAQNPHGGWPQVFPLEGGYHDAVTLNDDAMTHVLELMKSVAEMDAGLVRVGLKRDCQEAFEKGLLCAVRMQFEGKGWCGQHDAISLAPVAARAMEPAALVSVESANLLKVLMSVDEPDAALVRCIENGLSWLEEVALTANDEKSRKWARFYELGTDRPIYPGRDGVIYKDFDALARRNKVGYDYVSSRPGSVVDQAAKKWRKKLGHHP